MDRVTHIFFALIVTLTTVVGARSTFAQDRPWQPYLEMEGRASSVRTGEAISNAIIVDGTTVNPRNMISSAGTNGLVIADGSGGEITTGGTINMKVGQVIIGGGSGLAVSGCDTGARVTFTAPGTRAIINSGNNTNINAAKDACILGVDLVTSGVLAYGIYSFGNSQITVGQFVDVN